MEQRSTMRIGPILVSGMIVEVGTTGNVTTERDEKMKKKIPDVSALRMNLCQTRSAHCV